MAETSAISIDNYTPDFGGATGKIRKGQATTTPIVPNVGLSSVMPSTSAITTAAEALNMADAAKIGGSVATMPKPTPKEEPGESLDWGTAAGKVDGGSGYSATGASVGSLFGPKGTVIGAGVGGLVDIATGMVASYESREAERAMKREAEMREMKVNLKNDYQNRITNKQNAETHALNMDISSFNLANSKEQVAQAKADKFAKVVSGYYAKTSRGAL